jgi:hypothetical protein
MQKDFSSLKVHTIEHLMGVACYEYWFDHFLAFTYDRFGSALKSHLCKEG